MALAIRANHAQAVLPIAEPARNQTALPALRPRNARAATVSIQNAALHRLTAAIVIATQVNHAPAVRQTVEHATAAIPEIRGIPVRQMNNAVLPILFILHIYQPTALLYALLTGKGWHITFL